jgi:hypothetical protein
LTALSFSQKVLNFRKIYTPKTWVVTRAVRTVRQDDADRPRGTDREEKQLNLEGQLPQIIIGFPKRLKL